MREIDSTVVTGAVRNACIEACTRLPDDVLSALEQALEREESPAGRSVLKQLIENAGVARSECLPICQDTGIVLVFVDVGQDVDIRGSLEEAVNEGVRLGYSEGYLRNSVVRHPLDRVNTGDNTPAVLHTRIVPGDSLEIWVTPKGGGSENMSRALVLKPSDGLEGLRDFVVRTVDEAGPNPCPPVIVGVGIGGTLDMAAVLSKRALLRRVGEPSRNPLDADLERDLLGAVNATGVGPCGLGGTVTALAVHVESYPCHIASLPAAITLQCHAARHVRIKL